MCLPYFIKNSVWLGMNVIVWKLNPFSGRSTLKHYGMV